jgi:uncharacterized small protein (DUF1192 family)
MRRSGLCALVVALLVVGVVSGAATAVAAESGTVSQEQLLAEIGELKARIEELEATVGALSRELIRLRAEVSSKSQAEHDQREVGSDSSRADATEEQSISAWKTIRHGWEYRNASLAHDQSGSARFLVEIARTGSAVRIATLKVTLYDSSERIVATGAAVVVSMSPGDVRTVEFMLDGDVTDATGFRLQIDSEIEA